MSANNVLLTVVDPDFPQFHLKFYRGILVSVAQTGGPRDPGDTGYYSSSAPPPANPAITDKTVYSLADGVIPPSIVYKKEPEMTQKARDAKWSGKIRVSVVIGADGEPRDLRVVNSVGMGIDESAIDAISHWKFRPAQKTDSQ